MARIVWIYRDLWTEKHLSEQPSFSSWLRNHLPERHIYPAQPEQMDITGWTLSKAKHTLFDTLGYRSAIGFFCLC